ncbi:MAG: carboxypeptidase regulatory-like domain-containing protein [Bacteroidia bacterium]|nr:carboxypeptidase regulatory-like domain-containing protein [Bacteroidia bacterium]
MKTPSSFNFLLLFFLFTARLFSQTDATNGDWKSRNVLKANTVECDYMIRQGDIDNLGFGWEENFNPFTGKSTPSHAYPWERDSTEILGYDMILVPSSMGTKEAPCGGEGYSGQQGALKEAFGKTVFTYKIPLAGIDTSKIKNVSLQLFVDDFQSPVICSKFDFFINGKICPVASKSINSLNQTGPIGKLITIKVPANFISEFKKNEAEIFIDDSKTGAEDGFAIDFIKVMINPKSFMKGNLSGVLKDEISGKAIPNAIIEINDVKVKTDVKGAYKFTGIVAGLAVISVTAPGYPEKTFTVDIEENQSAIQDLSINKTP